MADTCRHDGLGAAFPVREHHIYLVKHYSFDPKYATLCTESVSEMFARAAEEFIKELRSGNRCTLVIEPRWTEVL